MRDRILIFLAGLFMAVGAYAGEAVLTWTPPTKNVDGSNLTDLTGYRVYYGPTQVTATQVLPVPAPASGATVPNLAPGAWVFAVSAVSAAGGESDKTGFVSTTIVSPKPLPPTGLTATARTAYTVVKRVDRFVMLPVGTVPAGTPCDTSQSVNGYYVVPRAAVTWSGSVQPDVVVASCS